MQGLGSVWQTFYELMISVLWNTHYAYTWKIMIGSDHILAYIDSLVQDCCISSANALEIQQSYIKPSICKLWPDWIIIRIKIGANWSFTIFQCWGHEPFVTLGSRKISPVLWVLTFLPSSFLSMVPEDAKSSYQMDDSGYDTYLRDAHRQVSAKSSHEMDDSGYDTYLWDAHRQVSTKPSYQMDDSGYHTYLWDAHRQVSAKSSHQMDDSGYDTYLRDAHRQVSTKSSYQMDDSGYDTYLRDAHRQVSLNSHIQSSAVMRCMICSIISQILRINTSLLTIKVWLIFYLCHLCAACDITVKPLI